MEADDVKLHQFLTDCLQHKSAFILSVLIEMMSDRLILHVSGGNTLRPPKLMFLPRVNEGGKRR